MQSPLERTGTEQYWLRARDVSDSETIAGDSYLREHDVTRPADVTAADLPPTDSEAVREIDREALEQRKLVGKWQVTVSPDRLETLWPGFVADAEAGTIWAVKAMTAFGHENLPMYEDYILTVYRESRQSASGSYGIEDFRDDERLRLSNHLTPRVNAVTMAVFS